MTHRLVVLISGSGTNLQAIIDAISARTVNATISAVISNQANAQGLQRARNAGISTAIVEHHRFASRQAFDQALTEEIDRAKPDTLVLAGFMRILTPAFVQHYAGRLINIHPSLLPRYPGLNTHQRALTAGDQEHGCSIHFVTEELDGGPVIAQGVVPVKLNDSVETLSKRVQQQEHRLYPLVLSWRAEGRVELRNNGVYLDGKALPETGYRIPWHDVPADQPATLRATTD